MVGLVLGLQNGYTMYSWIFWDSRAHDQHYVRQEWPLRQWLKPVLHNVQSYPLVEPNKILLPPLHIKLGVIKNFEKVMDRESSKFAFLQKFPWISMKKLKAGIFNSPQIRELMKDPMFNETLSEAELSTRNSFFCVFFQFTMAQCELFVNISVLKLALFFLIQQENSYIHFK